MIIDDLVQIEYDTVNDGDDRFTKNEMNKHLGKDEVAAHALFSPSFTFSHFFLLVFNCSLRSFHTQNPSTTRLNRPIAFDPRPNRQTKRKRKQEKTLRY